MRWYIFVENCKVTRCLDQLYMDQMPLQTGLDALACMGRRSPRLVDEQGGDTPAYMEDAIEKLSLI